jgi:hypothetical protein
LSSLSAIARADFVLDNPRRDARGMTACIFGLAIHIVFIVVFGYLLSTGGGAIH